jgi:hypothetical protein
MAQPGEFFPQQFAQGILQLAAAQKQFQARLREQRSQAAASNFLEKQRVELAERAASLAEFKAGMTQAQSQQGQSAVGGFRQRSAEGAMGVQDQLRLERGSAGIKRAAKLQDQTDGAIVQKALADWEDKGFAVIPAQSVDTIGGFRKVLQETGDPSAVQRKEIVKTGPKGDLVSTGEFEVGPAGLVETKLPNGDVLIARVGGTSSEDKRQLAELQKLELTNRKTVAEIGLKQMETESARQLAIKRAHETRNIALGLGQDEGLKRLSAGLKVANSAGMAKNLVLERSQEELNSLVFELGRAGEAEQADIKQRMLAVREEISQIKAGDATQILIKESPKLAPLLNALKPAVAGAQTAAAHTQSGQAVPGGDPSLREFMDQNVIRILNMTPVDFAMELEQNGGKADDGAPKFPLRNAYKILPTNVTIPLTNARTGAREPARFHVDPMGLIPQTKSAALLARDIARKTPEAIRRQLEASGVNLAGTEQFKIHPLWQQLGFPLDGPGTSNNLVPASPTPAAATPEEARAEAQQATKENQEKIDARRLGEIDAMFESTSPDEQQTLLQEVREIGERARQ